MKKIVAVLSMIILSLSLLSCSGASESKDAKNISLTVSSTVYVLPYDLSATTDANGCLTSDVSAPRVQFHSSIKWSGTGDLSVFSIQLSFSDPRFSATLAKTAAPPNGHDTVLGTYDGVAGNYIASGDTNTYSTTKCYLNFSSLPAPITAVTGTAVLEVPATITLYGSVKDSSGERPVVKQVSTTVVYTAGSVIP